MNLSPLILENDFVRLEPLRPNHLEPLWQVANEPRVWEHFWVQFRQKSDVANYIARYESLESRGEALAFAIWSQEQNRFVGASAFLDFQSARRSVEIGSTWLSIEVWNTKINPAAKFLLLEHGFERLNLVRIFFKTDARNLRSQAALQKLGATREGVLRKHMQRPDGSWRDSVYFSILDDEWPHIKTALIARLA